MQRLVSWTCMQSFSFIPLIISEKIFEYFFKNLSFMLPWQPIKLSNLDKIHMNRRGLLKKHFCKKNLNIYSETAKTANFHFSGYKSTETVRCHSNQSSYPIGTKKTILFIPSTYRCYVWNMARISFMASEEMSFENVDDVRTMMDGQQMPAYTISSPMSLQLRWAKYMKMSKNCSNHRPQPIMAVKG